MATIFVVDDHVDSCQVMARLLGTLDHTAHCFQSGEEVLDAMQSVIPEAMILDLMMPGIDGMEVLRRIKAEPRTAPVKVIVHSAVADPQVVKLAREKGASSYWPKAVLSLTMVEQDLDRVLGSGD